MGKNLITSVSSYRRGGRRMSGYIIVAVVTALLIVGAAIALPVLAPNAFAGKPTVVAIVPQNNAMIGIGANPDEVFVTIRYSNNTEETKSLAELLVTGLDTSEEGTLDNVVLDFGGFRQRVSYQVLPIEMVLNYFAGNGGRIEGQTTQRISAGSDASTVKAVANEGYQFKDWSDGNPNAERTDKKVSSSKEIIARFQLRKYTVIFYYPDGTTGREQIVDHGMAAYDIPDPTQQEMLKYGYRFIGWSVSQDNLQYITADTNVYPIYEKYAADLTMEYTLGIEGTPLGTSNAVEYYPKEVESTIRVKANPDKTFTGWQIKTYTGVYVTLQPEDTNMLIEINTANNAVSFRTSRTGTSDEYVLTFTPTKITDEINVRATFVYNTSVITFTSMSNIAHEPVEIPVGTSIGAFFGVNPSEAEEDFDAVTLPAVLGYAFKGWYIKNGAVDELGKPVIIKNAQTFDRPCDLIAYWEKLRYPVVFRNGYDGLFADNMSSDITLSVYYQDSLAGEGENKFPEVTPNKINYDFAGWYLLENGAMTNRIVDKTYKVEKEFTEIAPKFVVKKKNLTLIIEGSGSVKIRKVGENIDKNITGIYPMEVISNYIVKFKADIGYYIVSIIDTKSGTIHYSNDDPIDQNGVVQYEDEYELPIDSVIDSDYQLTVVFKLRDYTLNITNGEDAGVDSGSVSYQIVKDQELITEVKTDVDIPLKISSGISKNFWIEARKGYYIDKILVNDVSVFELPEEAEKFVKYTLVLENVSGNIIVKITYQLYRFDATIVNDEPLKGDLFATVAGKYTMYDEPAFEVYANEGYYIKSLTINGTAVDPYRNTLNYRIDNLMVMGVMAATGTGFNDERVTAYYLTVRNIVGNITLKVTFAKLYYKVKVNTQGFGSVNIDYAIVNYADQFSITATTTGGYYISSYSVNGGIPDTYTDRNGEQIITLESVREDKTVTVEFKRRTYVIAFTGNHAELTYTESKTAYTETLPKSLTKESASNEYYIIRAKEGYKIESVSVNGVTEDIAFNSTLHELRIDNINGDYAVEVVCVSLTYAVKYYFANQSDDLSVYVESDTVQYNEIYKMTIGNQNGKHLDKEEIKVFGIISKLPVLCDIELNDTEVGYELSVSNFYEDIEIFIPVFDNESIDPGEQSYFAVDLTFDEAMGTMAVTGIINGNTENPGDYGSVTAGTNLMISVLPVSGEYILKYLTVNGERIYLTGNEFTLQNIQKDQHVHAVFDRRLFHVSIYYNEYGVVAAEKSVFTYGDTFKVRLVASSGYEVTYFAIGSRETSLVPRDSAVLAAINAGQIDYNIPVLETTSDLDIEIIFSPKKFVLVFDSEGSGSLDARVNEAINVSYGERYAVKLTADESHYIESIKINGADVNLLSLSNYKMNEIQKYTECTLDIDITGNTIVEVVFSPNTYRVTVANTINGTTLVSTSYSYPSNGVNLKMSTGDDLTIRMVAEAGYHIESLEINGVLIEDWRLDEKANNNRSIDYVYENVRANLYIKVNYAVNYYEISYNISNASVNFSRFDTAYSQYGTFSIYGYSPSTVYANTYEDIRHGTDLKFMFSPVKAKGYYVSLFTISWVDPDNRESNQMTTLNFTSEAATNDSYIFTNVRGNLQIELEFKRQLFTFSKAISTESNKSPFVSDGTLDITYINPYSGSSSDAQLVDGKYEYGLSYIANVNPGTGYTLTSFILNGNERRSSVRSGVFMGEIKEHVTITAKYTIASYRIDLVGNEIGGFLGIYDDNGSLVWERGKSNETGSLPPSRSGCIEVFDDYIIATYGTNLTFKIYPYNENNGNDKGYMITSLIINNIRQTVNNADAVQSILMAVTSKLKVEAAFALHKYSITLEYNEYGGVTIANPQRVEWNNNVTISLTMLDGYNLIGIKINNNTNSDIFNAIAGKKQASFTLNNVRKDTVVTFLYERKPYNITFKGGYEQTFSYGGNDYNSVTGVAINDNTLNPKIYFSSKLDGVAITQNASIIDNTNIVYGGASGARYMDKLTFYFMPVNGYRIGSVNITMKDMNFNDITLLVRPEDLTVYDAANGYYSFSIANMTGDVSVTVNYTIKTYIVRMSLIGRGRTDSTAYTLVSHHEDILLKYIAEYGYHLQSLTINDNVIPVEYSKSPDNGLLVYKYTTSYGSNVLNINDALVNAKAEISITARFEINTFAVKMYVNNKDIMGESPDTTLALSLANNSVYYGQNARILQTRAEGYDITSIFMQNKENNPDTVLDYSYSGTVNNLNSDSLYFDVAGSVIDMLDYHSLTNKTLYVKYTTAIKMHYSVVNTYVYETNVPADSVPTLNGQPAFSLSATYNDGLSGNLTAHQYFTRATLVVNIPSAASNDYEFAGFQEYNTATGTWSYVSHNQNGISLSPDGYTLTYIIKGNRQFRAVVFRVYEVTVQIHPVYKYLSGAYSVDRFEMKYRTYASISATAQYTNEKKPNITDLNVTLSDSDGVVNDASYTFRLLSGAKLILRGTDAVNTINGTRSINYYYISYNQSGVIQQQAVSLATGAEIGSDRLVHAYFDNNLLLSFSLETEGGAAGNEGGSVKYYVQNSQSYLSNNSLKVAANARVRIEITPNSNYRYYAVYTKEALNEVDESNVRKFTDNWLPLAAAADGTTTIDYTVDGTGKITKVTINVIALENTIYKIKFWKLIQVTSNVKLFTSSETDNAALIAKYTPSFLSASPNGTYDYNATLTYILPTQNETDTWKLNSQFVGFFINGVNTYTKLGNSFPSSYTATYKLTEDSSVPNGVNINSSGGKFSVHIEAVYVPIYNLVFENEYKFKDESSGFTTYFDIGQITYSLYAYTMDRAQYYSSSYSVLSKLDQDIPTDKSVQILGRVNTLSADQSQSTSGYNTWNDNTITLNWTSSSSVIGNDYRFISWQYYVYQGGSWQWVNIPYADPNNAANKVTAKIFSFPARVLLEASYLNATEATAPGYKFEAAQYDLFGEYDNRTVNISAIRIRPLLQRVETVSIEREVYYTGIGASSDEHKNDNPARIRETGGITGKFNYYEIINLDPATQTGYRFLGWYVLAESSYVKVEYTGAFTPTQNVRLVGNVLQVRVTSTTEYYARYIKEWDITVQTVNISGISNELKKSVPKFDIHIDNGSGGYTELLTGLDFYTITLDAGAKFKFVLKTAGTTYNPEYECYDSTVSINPMGMESWSGSDANNSRLPNPDAASVAEIEAAYFIITAESAKTIEVRFRTMGQLLIKNIYYASAVKIPKALAMAIGREDNPFIFDGGSGDWDGIANAQVLIKKIPIVSGADYDGNLEDYNVFGNQLPRMQGYYIRGLNVYDYGINFDGDQINTTNHAKLQTVIFYNGNDLTGASKLDVPFDKGLTSEAGDGTSAKPFLINTANQLAFIHSMYINNNNTVGGTYFKLNNNINANGKIITAMCNVGNGFDGILDGGNYSIYDLVLSQSGTNYVGLFAQIYGGTARNIALGGTNANISGSDYVGYLTGKARGATITDIKIISNDTSPKYVSGYAHVGGLVGYADESTVISDSNLYNFYVYGWQNVGGMVGSLGTYSRIQSSYADTVFVRGSNRVVNGQTVQAEAVGGLVGQTIGNTIPTDPSPIKSCYVNNVVILENQARYTGGLVGKNTKNIELSYVTGSNIQIRSNYSSSNFTNPASYAGFGGGVLVGYNLASGNIMSCFVDGSSRITLEGTFSAGFVAINFGKIQNCTNAIRSRTFYTTRSVGVGGVFGVLVAYNAGEITGTTVGGSKNTAFDGNATYLITTNGSTDYRNGEINEGYGGDSSTIFLGGLAGYNADAGKIISSSFSGTLMMNRKSGNNVGNTSYMGAIAGYNTTASNLTSVTSSNASVMLYHYVWADAGGGTNPATSYQYIGTVTGNNTGSASVSGAYGYILVVANGSSYTDWQSPTLWFGGKSASNYNTASFTSNLYKNGGSGGITWTTTQSIPDSLYNETKFSFNKTVRRYTGKLRQVRGSANNY